MSRRLLLAVVLLLVSSCFAQTAVNGVPGQIVSGVVPVGFGLLVNSGSDWTGATSTLGAAPGWSWSLNASTNYFYECSITWKTSAASGDSADFSIGFSVAPTASTVAGWASSAGVGATAGVALSGNIAATGQSSVTGGTKIASTAVGSQAANFSGSILVGSTATTFTVGASISAGTLTVRAGSACRVSILQ